MHELGIVYEIVKVVDGFVKENQLTYVDKIVLEIGQLSQAIPRFIEQCYPAAVSDTPYENVRLEIVVIPAIGACKHCHTQYNVVDQRKICPKCGGDAFHLVSGQEFNIREIVGY